MINVAAFVALCTYFYSQEEAVYGSVFLVLSIMYSLVVLCKVGLWLKENN